MTPRQTVHANYFKGSRSSKQMESKTSNSQAGMEHCAWTECISIFMRPTGGRARHFDGASRLPPATYYWSRTPISNTTRESTQDSSSRLWMDVLTLCTAHDSLGALSEYICSGITSGTNFLRCFPT